MSKPDQHGMYYPLPENQAPVGTRCVQLEIPDDDQYEALLRGALLDLTKWYKYARDDSHLGTVVAKNWWVTFDSLAACDVPPNEEGFQWDMTSLCDSIRFSNGKLQVLCCGTWTDVDGQATQGIGGGGQPGGGTPVPTAGDCQDYSAQLSGNGTWYLPYAVSAGDTIAVASTNGAWSDPVLNAQWYCPDGSQFFLGACLASTYHYEGGDPLVSAPHMSLIALINGVYYPAAGGTITVPGGVTNAQVIFQANDSGLSDNSGEITFSVTACNNQAAVWSSVLNITVNPYVSDTSGSIAPPTYVAGQGYIFPSGPWPASEITIDFGASTTITSVTAQSLVSGFTSPVSNRLRYSPSFGVLVDPWITANGVNVASWSNPAGVTADGLNFALGVSGGTGDVTVQKVTITGLGVKPPNLP